MQASPWNMPDLGWYFGYSTLWIVIITTAAGLLLYFKQKRWL